MTQPQLRAIVVDDEFLAREGLASDLVDLNVNVLAVCDGPHSAITAIREKPADILFLDIEMPEMNGFALLEQFEPDELPPVIVFVTAYDQHAIRAFAVRAFDYLLKPASTDRLADTVQRAVQRIAEARSLRDIPEREEETGTQHIERLVVRERDANIVIPVDTIEWIEAETYYVRIHAEGVKPRLMRERMSVLEGQLDPAKFFRSHRSAIVRIDFIRAIEPVTRYESRIVLGNGVVVPLSKSRRDTLIEMLEGPRR